MRDGDVLPLVRSASEENSFFHVLVYMVNEMWSFLCEENFLFGKGD